MGLSTKLKRLIAFYLVLSGIAVNLAVVAYPVWHYLKSGRSPADYLAGLSRDIKVNYPSLSPVAKSIDRVFFDSGLLVTTARKYPRDLQLELPPWRGQGASVLRRTTSPRYDGNGRPVAIGDGARWKLADQPALRPVRVHTVSELQAAVSRARPGDEIVLAAGNYVLDTPLLLTQVASARQPIVVRGSRMGEVAVELRGAAAINIAAPYWAVSDLLIRGACGPGQCAAVFSLSDAAGAVTLRNLFVSGVRQLLSVRTGVKPSQAGLVEGVTLVGGRVGVGSGAVTTGSVRLVNVPAGAKGMIRVCSASGRPPLCDESKLKQAVEAVDAGGLLLLRAGRYRQAVSIDKPGLHIIAEPGAHLAGKAIGGKGAIVSNGDLVIEGLTCSEISVSSGNGACVRQQRGDLHLIGVHFYRAQMGVLTGHKGGRIRIEDSYIHDSGYSGRGNLGHNVYVNSGELEFIRSWSIAARNAGHEIKSRGSRTVISQSVVASANAVDSRLIDVPRGGELLVEHSLLLEGPRSENWELIGYGLEKRGQPNKYPSNTVTIRGNTVYFDRPNGSVLLNAKRATDIRVSGNVLIGARKRWPGNEQFESRQDAGLPAYPYMKKL